MADGGSLAHISLCNLCVLLSKMPAAGHRRTPKHLPKNMARDDGVQGGNHCRQWCSDFFLELSYFFVLCLQIALGKVLKNKTACPPIFHKSMPRVIAKLTHFVTCLMIFLDFWVSWGYLETSSQRWGTTAWKRTFTQSDFEGHFWHVSHFWFLEGRE